MNPSADEPPQPQRVAPAPATPAEEGSVIERYLARSFGWEGGPVIMRYTGETDIVAKLGGGVNAVRCVIAAAVAELIGTAGATGLTQEDVIEGLLAEAALHTEASFDDTDSLWRQRCPLAHEDR